MSPEEKIEALRSQIKQLQNERDIAILEKGFAANANEDLRENAQYDYWLEKEFYLTGKIKTIIDQINKLSITLKKSKTIKKKKKSKEIEKDTSLKTFKQKWL